MNRQVDKAIKKIKDNELNTEIFLEKEVLLFVDSIKKKIDVVNKITMDLNLKNVEVTWSNVKNVNKNKKA